MNEQSQRAATVNQNLSITAHDLANRPLIDKLTLARLKNYYLKEADVNAADAELQALNGPTIAQLLSDENRPAQLKHSYHQLAALSEQYPNQGFVDQNTIALLDKLPSYEKIGGYLSLGDDKQVTQKHRAEQLHELLDYIKGKPADVPMSLLLTAGVICVNKIKDSYRKNTLANLTTHRILDGVLLGSPNPLSLQMFRHFGRKFMDVAYDYAINDNNAAAAQALLSDPKHGMLAGRAIALEDKPLAKRLVKVINSSQDAGSRLVQVLKNSHDPVNRKQLFIEILNDSQHRAQPQTISKLISSLPNKLDDEQIQDLALTLQAYAQTHILDKPIKALADKTENTHLSKQLSDIASALQEQYGQQIAALDMPTSRYSNVTLKGQDGQTVALSQYESVHHLLEEAGEPPYNIQAKHNGLDQFVAMALQYYLEAKDATLINDLMSKPINSLTTQLSNVEEIKQSALVNSKTQTLLPIKQKEVLADKIPANTWIYEIQGDAKTKILRLDELASPSDFLAVARSNSTYTTDPTGLGEYFDKRLQQSLINLAQNNNFETQNALSQNLSLSEQSISDKIAETQSNTAKSIPTNKAAGFFNKLSFRQ